MRGMMRGVARGLMVASVMSAGCVTQRTPASITHIDKETFRACRVELGWNTDQLQKNCGLPQRVLRNANDLSAECWIYDTMTLNAFEFISTPGRSAFSICFRAQEDSVPEYGMMVADRRPVPKTRWIVSSVWAVETSTHAQR